jgi:hypothetical protein
MKSVIIRDQTVFIHQRHQKTPLTKIPELFWVSHTTRYYDEKYPEHLITLNRDINAVDMSNIYPDELEQLYHPTKKDILFAKQYSHDQIRI